MASRPESSIKAGGIELAVWPGRDGKDKSFSLQKSFKTKEGKWERTNFLLVRDLADVILTCQRALEKYRLSEKAAAESAPEHYTPDSAAPF